MATCIASSLHYSCSWLTEFFNWALTSVLSLPCAIVSDIWILELIIHFRIRYCVCIGFYRLRLYLSSLTIIFPNKKMAMQSTVCWWSDSTKDISATMMLVFDIYDYDALILSRIKPFSVAYRFALSINSVENWLDYQYSGIALRRKTFGRECCKTGIQTTRNGQCSFFIAPFRGRLLPSQAGPSRMTFVDQVRPPNNAWLVLLLFRVCPF